VAWVLKRFHAEQNLGYFKRFCTAQPRDRQRHRATGLSVAIDPISAFSICCDFSVNLLHSSCFCGRLTNPSTILAIHDDVFDVSAARCTHDAAYLLL